MQFKSFMEALKGKQHKIDKNKNGKIDSHDFKLLRKEDTEENNESFDFDRAALAKQKLQNLKSSGRKVRGASIANLMRASGLKEEELDETELDQLDEVLSKDAKAGDWISDFVHSTNPKFEGKSKKERINMALGAYYSTHKKKDGMSEQAPVAPVPDKKYIKGTPENKALKASRKPINGMPTNVKEEAEQIDEKSEQAKQNKTMKNMMDASRGAKFKLNNPVPDAEPQHKTAQAHNKAIGRSLRNEDKMTTTKDKSGKMISFKYEGDWKKTTKADAKKDPAGKVANMAGQAMQKMAKTNEEVEQIDELSTDLLGKYKTAAGASAKAADASGDYAKGNKRFKGINKATMKQFDNDSKKLNKEAKDPGEYDQEGDMAKTQLRSIKYHADELHEMLGDNDNLPEWVQSKLTLAQDYLQTVCDYMYSKDEVNEATDTSPIKVKVQVAGKDAEEEKWMSAKKKTVKESFDDEGNLISTKISYKDFITEIKLADLPSRRIQGHSYGASYEDPEGADDYDEKKPMKPAAEKRGRGRPAGAKSGARKITGTSKLMNK